MPKAYKQKPPKTKTNPQNIWKWKPTSKYLWMKEQIGMS